MREGMETGKRTLQKGGFMKYLTPVSITVVLVLSLIGCNLRPPSGPDPHSEQTVTLSPKAGQFGLSHMEGLARKSAASGIKEGSNVLFNLGKIKGSTGFYFLLYNTGSTPITDVALSIAEEGFSVFPATMDSLLPGSDVGMLPIVRVNAFHGTPLDGIGKRPVLPMGSNNFTLLITGKSKTEGGTDTTVALQAQMIVEALVLDFEMILMNGPLDLTVYNQGTACIVDSVLQIRNTGNVGMYLQITTIGDHNDLSDSITIDTALAVGTAFTQHVNTHCTIRAWGENTLCNPARVLQQDDGICTFSLFYNQTDCLLQERHNRFAAFTEMKRNENDFPKLYFTVDSTAIFYAEKNTSVEPPTYYFLVKDLFDTAMECSRSGPLGTMVDNCSNGDYPAILDAMVPFLTDPAFRDEFDKKGFPQVAGHTIGASGGGDGGSWWE